MPSLAFIAGLKHYRSHFLILKPGTMEEIRKIVTNVTRKKAWNKYSSSESDSDDSNDSDSTYTSSDPDDSFYKPKSTMDLKKRKSKIDNKDSKKPFSFEDKRKLRYRQMLTLFIRRECRRNK
jgi:hypothetical protein